MDIPQAVVFQHDISLEEDRLALANRLREQEVKVNILINNAGVQYHCTFDHSQPAAELIRSEIETNLIGPIRLISLLMDDLLKLSNSAIVNISSGLAIAPKASAPIYCASKAALSSFTRTLRYQLEHTSIKVVDVMAPLVDTDMTRGRGRGKMSPEAFAAEVIKGLKAGKEELRIGKVKLLYWIHRLFPGVAYRIMKHG